MKFPFEIRDSEIEGKGAFAKFEIPRGTEICVFSGEGKSFEWFQNAHEESARISCDHFQVDIHEYILLDSPYEQINHSCNPNAAFHTTRALCAIRDIREGEEITYDYSTTEWTPEDYPNYYTDGWPMKCACGEAQCRGLITCFPYLPKALQNQYIQDGHVQKFIAHKAQQASSETRCLVCEDCLAKYEMEMRA